MIGLMQNRRTCARECSNRPKEVGVLEDEDVGQTRLDPLCDRAGEVKKRVHIAVAVGLDRRPANNTVGCQCARKTVRSLP